MVDPSITNLTLVEVRALADRLQARAISALSIDTPTQQGDGLLAAAALTRLALELQTLRATVHRVAATCGDREAQQALFDALTPRGPHHSGVVSVRFDD